MELSQSYPIKYICDTIGINRSGFYKWLNRLNNFNQYETYKRRNLAIQLFSNYHLKYPSHGYLWLKTLINTENKTNFSNYYAHKICKFLGIKSKAKRIIKRYRIKNCSPKKYYPNLMLRELTPTKPYQIVVSDMTAFYFQNKYTELTLYMDLFNNEIISHKISRRRGDTKPYYDGLQEVINKRKEYGELNTIIHTDHGSVYASNDYDKLIEANNLFHNMSKPGHPNENGAMESINGWIKEEFFVDLRLQNYNSIQDAMNDYIYFFNYIRPAAALNYLTPIEYKKLYYLKH